MRRSHGSASWGALAAVAFLAISVSPAGATPGHLAVAFGHNGEVPVQIDSPSNRPRLAAWKNDVVLGSDLWADSSQQTASYYFARYRPDGSLDPSFGSGGEVTSHDPRFSRVEQILALPNGKLLAAGTGHTPDCPTSGCNGAPALLMLGADGSPDQSFGSGGIALASSDTQGRPVQQTYLNGIVLQPDGKILGIGERLKPDGSTIEGATYLRWNPNGSLDGSFGDAGVLRTDAQPAFTVLRESGGRYVGLRCVTNAGRRAVELDGFTGAFALDPAFGSGGSAPVPFGCGGAPGQGWQTDLIQHTGDILVAGNSLSLVRYDANGVRDKNFGGGGVAQIPGGDPVDVVQIFEQAAGRVIVVGGDFGSLAAFNPDGSEDATFDSLSEGTGGTYVSTAAAVAGDRLYEFGFTEHGTPRKYSLRAFDVSETAVAILARTQPLLRVATKGLPVPATCSSACTVTADLLGPSGVVAAARLVRIGHASKRLAKAGRATLRVKLLGKARRRIKKLKRVKLVLRTRVAPTHGKAVRKTQPITLER